MKDWILGIMVARVRLMGKSFTQIWSAINSVLKGLKQNDHSPQLTNMFSAKIDALLHLTVTDECTSDELQMQIV